MQLLGETVEVQEVVELLANDRWGVTQLVKLRQPETGSELRLVCTEECAPALRMAVGHGPIAVEITPTLAPPGAKGRTFRLRVTGIASGGDEE